MTKLKDICNWEELINGRAEFFWVKEVINRLSEVEIIELAKYKRTIVEPRRKKDRYLVPECYLGKDVYIANPYTGCLHGCSYCYAQYFKEASSRDLFEAIYVKKNFGDAVCNEIYRKPSLKNKVINFGSATDPYIPLELHYRFFRRIIEYFKIFDYWFFLSTKSNLVLRDIDLLKDFKKASIAFTLTSLDDDIMRIFQPNCTPAQQILEAVENLIKNEVTTIVRIDPIIPGVNDNLDSLKNMADVLKRIGVETITSGVLKAKFAMIQSRGQQHPMWRTSWYESVDEYKKKTGIGIENYIKKNYTVDHPPGYVIPPLEKRLEILAGFAEYVTSLGMKFSTCEMGLDLQEELGDNHFPYCACVYGLKTREKEK